MVTNNLKDNKSFENKDNKSGGEISKESLFLDKKAEEKSEESSFFSREKDDQKNNRQLQEKEIIKKEKISDLKHTDFTDQEIPLEQQKEINRLLKITDKKGFFAAIEKAKNKGDPYVLDKIHDIIIQKKYHKKFKK